MKVLLQIDDLKSFTAIIWRVTYMYVFWIFGGFALRSCYTVHRYIVIECLF